MSLKDDIEVLKSIAESIRPEVVRQSLLERLSRIEAALAIDDGPPIGVDPVKYLREIADKGCNCDEDGVEVCPFCLARSRLNTLAEDSSLYAEEVARRIEEAGK